MDEIVEMHLDQHQATDDYQPSRFVKLPASVTQVAVGSAAILAGCGGGGGEAGTSATPVSPPLTEVEASRFLAQSSMGATRLQIARVQSLGYAGWLDEQFSLPVSSSRWDYLIRNGFSDISFQNTETGFDGAAWSKLIGAPDTLRQRITLALTEIFVTAIDGLVGSGWRQFSAAAYWDLLEVNAFGSHRSLLQQISLCPAMGQFLTFRGSAKASTSSGALPDENYARELMQLFTIGLYQLNADGTSKLSGGSPIETYSLDDITGLARVFTGWDFDLAGGTTSTPDYLRRPMRQIASRYETGSKSFIGTTIPAGLDANQSLAAALDVISKHPNVAPFFGKQLIQRLVTSNPSPAYIARISAVFNDDGNGVRGNFRAVIKALLLDVEARSTVIGAGPTFGKLREPILRFAGWARAFNLSSPSDKWAVGNTSDPATGLAQSPLRSTTVFNFFRPGYVPPNSPLGTANLVAPEFQISNESSVVGYVNFMQRAVAGSLGDLAPDYASLISLADDAKALVDEINVVLAANQLSGASAATISVALQTMPSGSDTARRNRTNAALVLVLACPEYIVQK